MKHERDELVRQSLPPPQYHRGGVVFMCWTKPEPATDRPAVSTVFHTIHLVRRYLPSGECIWYEPADNNR